jgi:hypothetical protein
MFKHGTCHYPGWNILIDKPLLMELRIPPAGVPMTVKSEPELNSAAPIQEICPWPRLAVLKLVPKPVPKTLQMTQKVQNQVKICRPGGAFTKFVSRK